jgi:hypothetical protein
MADDPTPGELNIKLDNLLDRTKDVQENMVRKDVLSVWQDDIRGQIGSVKQETANVETRLGTRLGKLESAFADAEKDIKTAGRARVNMWIVAGLGIVATGLINLFWPSP